MDKMLQLLVWSKFHSFVPICSVYHNRQTQDFCVTVFRTMDSSTQATPPSATWKHLQSDVHHKMHCNFTTSTHSCRNWLTGIWATTQRANLKCFAITWNRKRKSESKEAMCFLTIRWHNNYDTGPLSLQLQSVWSVIYFNTELSGFNVHSCYFLLDCQFITPRLWWQWLNLSRDQLVTSTSIAHHIKVFDFVYL